MFEISWSEILVMAVVAIIVYGPDDLPKALRGLGRMMREMKRYTGAVQKTFENIVEEDELKQIVRDLNKAGDTDHVLFDEQGLEQELDEFEITDKRAHDKKTDQA